MTSRLDMHCQCSVCSALSDRVLAINAHATVPTTVRAVTFFA